MNREGARQGVTERSITVLQREEYMREIHEMKEKRPYVTSALMAMLVMTITACAGGLVGSKEEKLGYFESLENEPLARLVKEQPKTEQELAQSAGYAVIEKKVVKIPMVGAGGGAGVVVEKASGKKSYLRVPEL